MRLAQSTGGRVHLRIDDLDEERIRIEYIEHLFLTLEFFGVEWDTGPTGPTDLEQNWSQKHRIERYNGVLQAFASTNQLFACTCSRTEILAGSIDGEYPGTCVDRGLPFDAEETSWRINDAVKPGQYALLRQKNRRPSYMIASIVDDVDLGITHVIRGADLAPSTEVQQRIAARHVDLASFCHVSFEHHPLILGSDGEKLSKSVVGRTQSPPTWGVSDKNMVERLADNYLGSRQQSD